jgi:hypothetical protein
MRTLFIFLLAAITATPGFATVDGDFDQIGVYFDLEADQTCLSVGANIPFDAYVVLTKPSDPEVWGFEFGFRIEVPEGFEGAVLRLANTPACLDLINDPTWWEGDWNCGVASPIPFAGENIVVLTWQFMLLTPDLPMLFYVGPADVESVNDGLPAYLGSVGIVPLGVSSGDPGLPVAIVNGECNVVTVDGTNFGSLKSLYR